MKKTLLIYFALSLFLTTGSIFQSCGCKENNIIVNYGINTLNFEVQSIKAIIPEMKDTIKSYYAEGVNVLKKKVTFTADDLLLKFTTTSEELASIPSSQMRNAVIGFNSAMAMAPDCDPVITEVFKDQISKIEVTSSLGFTSADDVGSDISDKFLLSINSLEINKFQEIAGTSFPAVKEPIFYLKLKNDPAVKGERKFTVTFTTKGGKKFKSDILKIVL